ncbi:MAG: type II CRISPR RNA-guided endonuclease Cas9 [Bacteroidales bacterium]|nr:type II CRISPR RNA-guided endonuclease Cas9 [Candidatus Liminaster caballi]
MKNILGLDLGTNSIGWAVVQQDNDGNYQHEIKLGTRIIPMQQDVISKFEGGSTIVTQTAARTQKRGMRHLNERRILRRERLLRVLHVLGFLPIHFDHSIGWDRNNTKTFGKFINPSKEPKIAWCKDSNGKASFLFQSSFEEMLADFQKHQPLLVSDQKKIPYDWTLYYLRQKALSAKITKEELAWILLSFNQKRGYYQLRGKDDELMQDDDKTKRVEYIEQLVVAVDTDEKESPKGRWYNVHLQNGMVYRRQSTVSLADWIGKTRAFVVTTQLEADGSEKLDKDGNVKRSFRSPGPDDWTLRKLRSEQTLAESGLTVGAYIYNHLLTDPSDKIIGGFIETIDRHYYKEELYAILRHQAQYHSELIDPAILQACSQELYSRNEAHQANLLQKDLIYMLVEDVLFYQRPLKSKKSLISECPYESHEYVNKDSGEVKTKHVKCIAKSNPYFQEFRIRQFIQNLKIYDTTGLREQDVTSQYINATSDLYQWLSERKSVTEESLIKDFLKIKKPKGKDSKYPIRWNYVQDKEYPMGETRSAILKAFDKAGISSTLISDAAVEYRLWHLLYSISDVKELEGALYKFAQVYGIEEAESFVESFKTLKPFEKDYGSYSEKAIKRLLPFIRQGKSLHEACYEVYGRYSEGLDTRRWTSPSDIYSYIQSFQQHSLRNPIVEQCILETLRTVAAIWEQEGHIDEIHLELGREMKNPADKRRRISDQNQRNEATNLRIKSLLIELLNDPTIQDVRPNSPMQQDILRLYEEGALLELRPEDPDYKDILAISQAAQPTSTQLTRYKLWLEQRYRSPYTGHVIPLAKLFTPAYQIEHVIPRARYYDDSLMNKVICEAAVNKDKTNLLAHEYISKNGGKMVQTADGPVKVFTLAEYEQFVKDHYGQIKPKHNRLMMDDVPEEFIQRQMNDSRYISKVVKSLLSNIVREEDEPEDMSKHVIVCTGSVTDRLKKDWGMHDVWNNLVYPRYERLNRLTGTSLFGHWDNKNGHQVFQTEMPLELQKGYSKKRIDHRHHAMDALVIACAHRNVVNLLSNINAHDSATRFDLKQLYSGKGGVINKPWPTFTHDAELALSSIVVSFRNKVRVLARATNKYEHYDKSGHKIMNKQDSKQYVVRQSLHDEFVFAHVNLRRTKIVSLSQAIKAPDSIIERKLRHKIYELRDKGLKSKQIEALILLEKDSYKFDANGMVLVSYMTDETSKPLSAIRRSLDTTFDLKKIENITDTGIQFILRSYLNAKNNDPTKAFSFEGIEELNANISIYNNGKPHQPIHKVRVCESLGAKYPVGHTINKFSKFVQGAAHLFFAIYEQEGIRSYYTAPLEDVVVRLKEGLLPVPDRDKNGFHLKFYLSPNDLVYVPTEDELLEKEIKIDKSRIFKFISSDGSTAYFLPMTVASLLKKKAEFESLDKSEKAIDIYGTYREEVPIKSVCWKLEVDRLGNITKIIR